MRFRPCIDIHCGKVKQIIGATLNDGSDKARENFTADKGADYYAAMYRADGLKGGHVIMLNAPTSLYYEETKKQALSALLSYPGGLQIGGGITPENAAEFLNAGASHVIVTSYVFRGGRVHWQRLARLRQTVGKKRLVLDLSCRERDGNYYIMTDRWQKETDEALSANLLHRLSVYCDEFLVHGVEFEGLGGGPDLKLVKFLAESSPVPATYAGGIANFKDMRDIETAGRGRVDFTVGSALDIFGGELAYREIVRMNEAGQNNAKQTVR